MPKAVVRTDEHQRVLCLDGRVQLVEAAPFLVLLVLGAELVLAADLSAVVWRAYDVMSSVPAGTRWR